jgi:hypothetical protein
MTLYPTSITCNHILTLTKTFVFSNTYSFSCIMNGRHFILIFIVSSKTCFASTSSSFSPELLPQSLVNLFFHLQSNLIGFIYITKLMCTHIILNMILQPIHVSFHSLILWFLYPWPKGYFEKLLCIFTDMSRSSLIFARVYTNYVGNL